MKISIICATILGSFLLIGCGNSPKDTKVSVSGYACASCHTQFYVTGGINAQQCPQCKEFGINDLMTYVCPADQQKMVSIRKREGVACKQCRDLIEAVQYPTEEELKAAGATKKSAAEVGAK